MSRARMIEPENVWLITRRVSERRMFLKPGPAVNAIFQFVLGWACGLFQMTVLAVYVGSNHYHLVVYDPEGRVSCFAERLNSYLARYLNYRWKRVKMAFWDNQGLSLVRLVDAEAIINAAAYCAANPTQDGLLEDPEQWPGVRLTARHLAEEQRTERPKSEFFGRRSKMPKATTIPMGLPPQLEHLTIAEYRKKHDAALKANVEAAKDKMTAAGRQFMGLKKLAAVRPNQRARRKEPSGARNTIKPRVAASCAAARIAALQELAAFEAAYAAARKRFIEGERDVEFPSGTYRLAHQFGVAVKKRAAT